jgi:hypothetical protein
VSVNCELLVIGVIISLNCEFHFVHVIGSVKSLRKIFDPVQDRDGSWRIRTNHELSELRGNADTVKWIKSRRVWLGHVMRMD